MESTILYCKKCDSLFSGAEGQTTICPTCKTELIETHCSESKWDSMNRDEKRSLKQQWKGPAEAQNADLKAEPRDEPGLSDDAVVSIKAFFIIACAVLLIIGSLWCYGFCKAYYDIKNEEGLIIMAYRISNKGLNPVSKSGYKTCLHNYPRLERQVKSFIRY